jgi:hypothetical protein
MRTLLLNVSVPQVLWALAIECLVNQEEQKRNMFNENTNFFLINFFLPLHDFSSATVSVSKVCIYGRRLDIERGSFSKNPGFSRSISKIFA